MLQQLGRDARPIRPVLIGENNQVDVAETKGCSPERIDAAVALHPGPPGPHAQEIDRPKPTPCMRQP